MNAPPDQTTVFSAANACSSGRTTVVKCSRNSWGCSRSAVSVSVSVKITPLVAGYSWIWWYTASDSYWAITPDTSRCRSAWVTPSRS